MTFGWKGAQRQAVWSIYTDFQSFLGTFPIQKVSILAVEDYSFEDELKLVEIRILVYQILRRTKYAYSGRVLVQK